VSAWLRQHRAALRAALLKLAAQRAAGVAGLVAIGIALALPTLGYALLESLRPLLARASLEPRITVFLKAEVPRADAESFARTLRAEPRVASLRFVPRETALRELEAVAGFSEVVAALGRNPLPDAYVIGTRDPDSGALEALASELRRKPPVAEVQLEAAWARRLAALASLGRAALLLVSALLAFGLIAVTFSTTRLQILTQRDEIEVSRLIGATDAFVRRPFYYLGLLQGLLGGALALLVVRLGVLLLNRELAALADSYGSTFRFSPPGAGDSGAVLGLAAVLGWLGAHLSLGTQLRADSSRR
jgi:cell division transport system permease protein